MKEQSQHIAKCVNAFLDHLPEEQRKRILTDRKIKRVHQQFASCVDPFILQHVNSVYMNQNEDDVSHETNYSLVVYVDNSTVAAELNAQRELIVLKYRESFAIKIQEFKIKISRGAYLENHPFWQDEHDHDQLRRKLSTEERAMIDEQTSSIEDTRVRESFQRLLIAIKEHQPE